MEVRELAYQLWKSDIEANKPEKSSDDYWKEAEFQLSPQHWRVSSGALCLKGEGPLQEVIDNSLRHANYHTICLGESMTVTENGESRQYVIETIPQLIRLGLAT